MAEPARSVPAHDPRPAGVVRPLSRAATRRCSRPGCPTPATATLTFRYDLQEATLGPLLPDGGPETYDLCGDHADRTRPPHGWHLEDGRPEEVVVDTPDPEDLGSERTVALLAAALRGQDQAEEGADATPEAPTVEDAAPDDPPSTEASDPVAQVDTAALDAIVDAPFDEPALDLYGTTDEADPAEPSSAPAHTDALDELSALSHHDDEDGGVVEQVPARTVPGAHRPA